MEDPIPTPIETPTEIPSTPPLTPKLVLPDEPTSLPAQTLADVAKHILDFLQHATPETLGGVMVGSTVVLYMVFGSLGLLVVGVIGGVVLHASLENLRPNRARNRGVTVGGNVVDWLDAKILEIRDTRGGVSFEEGGQAISTKSSSRVRVPDFSTLPPETAMAFTELADAVTRDYVRWWYTPILPTDENFPNACRQMLTQTLFNIHSHLSQKRPTDTFLLFLISTSNTFIVLFRELAQSSQTSIGTYVEEYPSSALAQLVDRDMQKRKLRMAADDIVQSFVPEGAVRCDPVRAFLTEIIAGVVLEKLVEKFSSAEWINATIVYLLEKETQPEILQKIDIGDATAAANDKSVAAAAEQNRQKRISRAEEEMEQALKEAQEINAMIAEEEAKRSSGEWSGRNGNGYLHGTETSTRASSDNGVSIPPSIAEEPTSPSTPSNTFTSFDQLLPAAPAPDPLYRANITLSDLTPPDTTLKISDPFSGAAFSSLADKPLRSKPTSAVYLLQIEPGISSVPGWILTRKYIDFETLHEVLRRISSVSGVDTFARAHADLPSWRGCTKESLRARLERYINDALKEKSLTECEGMKRFLEKDGETGTGPGRAGAFGGLGKGWPNPQAIAKMGGGVLDALTKAPQGAAEGGKALFGGVFLKRGLSIKENSGGGSGLSTQDSNRRSSMEISKHLGMSGSQTSLSQGGEKEGCARIEEEKSRYPARRSSLMGAARPNRESYIQLEIPSGDGDGVGFVSLPPPPSDIPDDYDHDTEPAPEAALTRSRAVSSASTRFLLTPAVSAPIPVVAPVSVSPPLPPSPPTTSITPPPPPPPPPSVADTATPPPLPKRKTTSEPLSEAETQFVVEIFFAVITELYTLSSAWIFRRSLLNVAKSILLRPGNANLEAIRMLIQESVIDANTVDSAIAEHIRKLRKNGFPSKEERAAWPPVEEMGGSEKEALREKARRLVGERGMPEALRGLMGAQASKECWGVVFDALQERGVARGVIAGLVGEAVRGVCH